MSDNNHIDDTKKYVNFICPRCGETLSIEFHVDDAERFNIYRSKRTWFINNQKFHTDCPKKIDTEEHIALSLLSYTNGYPLGEIIFSHFDTYMKERDMAMLVLDE